MNKNKGFSLVEIMMVIFVLGILVYLSVINLRNYQSAAELKAARRDLISDLRFAQENAVAEQCFYSVRLSKISNSYQIIKKTDPEEITREKNLPSGIQFNNITGLAGDEIKFNFYGATNQDGQIDLINTGGIIISISVRPSGYIKVL